MMAKPPVKGLSDIYYLKLTKSMVERTEFSRDSEGRWWTRQITIDPRYQRTHAANATVQTPWNLLGEAMHPNVPEPPFGAKLYPRKRARLPS